MIISDHYKFSFIHIPKCAGSAIKVRIEGYDDLKGRFTKRVDSHPELGELDYGHMPLFILKDYFPDEFDRVRRYFSFAVLREPHSRFLSGISQRMKMYRNTYLHAASDMEIIDEIDFVVNALKKRSGCLPPDLIHFQRQVDYILLDGERVLSKVYLSSEVDVLLSDLARRVGIDQFPDPEKNDTYAENKSFVFKNEAMRLAVEAVRPAALAMLSRMPESLKRSMRSALYTSPSARLKKISDKIDLHSFIEDHYADDIAIISEVKSGPVR